MNLFSKKYIPSNYESDRQLLRRFFGVGNKKCSNDGITEKEQKDNNINVPSVILSKEAPSESVKSDSWKRFDDFLNSRHIYIILISISFLFILIMLMMIYAKVKKLGLYTKINYFLKSMRCDM